MKSNNKYLANEYLSLWLILSLVLVYALVYMTKNCYSAAMVLLVEEGVLTKSQTGVISAAFYIVYAPFQIAGGIAADRYSPFGLIAIGLLGAALCNILILFNSNYYFMMAVWSLNGIIQFGIWPSVFRLASTVLSPVHRHKGVFYVSLASVAGLVISYLVASLVSTWRQNFIVSAIVLLGCFIYWIFMSKKMTDKLVDENDNYHGIEHLPEAVKNDGAGYDGSFFRLMLRSGLGFIMISAVLQTILSQGVQSITPSMMAESYSSISSSMASIITIIPVIMGLIGKLLMNKLYELKPGNECAILSFTMAVLIPIMLGMLFIGKIPSLIIIVAVSLVTMIANGSYLLITSYVTMRFSKLGCGATVSGILNCMASLGIVMANLVVTAIADNFGWIAVIISWIIFTLCCSLIFLAAYIPWKRFIKSL